MQFFPGWDCHRIQTKSLKPVQSYPLNSRDSVPILTRKLETENYGKFWLMDWKINITSLMIMYHLKSFFSSHIENDLHKL